MKPEDVAEEHRKYLDISDNPKKPTNASIFVMVSEGLIKLESKVNGVELGLGEKINGVKVDVAKIEVRGEERHNQQRREQKVVIAVLLSLFGFVLWSLGIPIPLP